MNDDKLTIQGKTVEAESPEGVTAKMPVAEFISKLAPERPSSGGIVLPDGIRMLSSSRSATVLVWELEPMVHRVQWISAKSPAPYGGRGQRVLYEFRELALPYLIMFVVFVRNRSGRLVLSGRNEAYFRNEPLKRDDDELRFPALLNISKFRKELTDRSPLAWICTQNTNLARLAAIPDDNERFRASLCDLRKTMIEDSFNYSSEHHEFSSYWTLSAKKIPDIADLDRWERRSREDPLFVLELPWLAAMAGRKKMTVKKLIERIFAQNGSADPVLDASGSLAGIVYNNSASAAKEEGK